MSTRTKRTSPEFRGWDREVVARRISQLQQPTWKVELDPSGYTNTGAIDYKLVFKPKLLAGSDPVTKVAINILIGDWQVDSDIVITTMSTIPRKERGNEYGTQAIKALARWAVRNNFNEIRATQVSNPKAVLFWERLGFNCLPPPNKTADYILKLPQFNPRTMHRHKCRNKKCGTIWYHPNNCRGDRSEHTCPLCGYTRWLVYSEPKKTGFFADIRKSFAKLAALFRSK